MMPPPPPTAISARQALADPAKLAELREQLLALRSNRQPRRVGEAVRELVGEWTRRRQERRGR